jgi:hypothetical protein
VTFFDAIDNALAAWFAADFADTVIYNGTQIYGHVVYDGGGSGANAKHGTVIVQVSDVAIPAYRDTVVIDGETWTVVDHNGVDGDGHTWSIPVVRDEKPRAF